MATLYDPNEFWDLDNYDDIFRLAKMEGVAIFSIVKGRKERAVSVS